MFAGLLELGYDPVVVTETWTTEMAIRLLDGMNKLHEEQKRQMDNQDSIDADQWKSKQ